MDSRRAVRSLPPWLQLNSRGRWQLLLAVLLLAQFWLRGADSLGRESPVWDERLHLGYGVALLDRGPTFDAQDHPYPLAALLALPTWAALAGPDRFSQLDLEDPRQLLPARHVNLALATLALAALAAWARRRQGPGFALAVLALAATDPQWLAVARYVTLDVGHAFGWWLAAWALAELRARPTLRSPWVALAAAGLALGLSAKFSALAIPLLALLILPRARTVPALAAAALTASGIALLGLLALGCELTFAHPATLAAPDVAAHHWLDGLWASWAKRSHGAGAYLLGTWYQHGTRLYLPLLLVAKSPLTQLTLAACGLLGLLRRGELRTRLRPETPWLALLLGYLLLASASRQNLGQRHLAPGLPVLWWLGAQAWLRLRAWAPPGRWVSPALALGLAVESAMAHPHYLAWNNALFGGTAGAPAVAVDAAADWGQALPTLARYLAAEPSPSGRVDLAYFGNADPQRFVGPVVARPCGLLAFHPPRERPSAGCAAPADLLVVSATCVHGGTGVIRDGRLRLDERDPCWARLRERRPDAVLAGSLLVFRGEGGH